MPSIRKTPLTDAEVAPKPLQAKIRIWHGSATAERSVELAAEFGDPVFSANGMNPVTRYAELIRHYRSRWTAADRDLADALVGSPAQVIDKVGGYHEAFGNRLIAIGGHPDHLTRHQFLASLELFQAEVAPALRRSIPDPEWPGPVAEVRRRPAGSRDRSGASLGWTLMYSQIRPQAQ